MAIQSFTVDPSVGNEFTIYAEEDNINFFLGAALVPDSASPATNGQTQVSGHTRSQYPGDPTAVNVAGSTREYLIDLTRKSGNGLPGKSFVLAAMDTNGAVIEKRQFTYKGRWIDLHAFLTAEAAGPMFAYNHTGARYSIADPTPA